MISNNGPGHLLAWVIGTHSDKLLNVVPHDFYTDRFAFQRRSTRASPSALSSPRESGPEILDIPTQTQECATASNDMSENKVQIQMDY
jgi:hypothetical protein